jgi:hypothetical protein
MPGGVSPQYSKRGLSLSVAVTSGGRRMLAHMKKIASSRSGLNSRQNCAADDQGCAKKHEFGSLKRRI